MIGALLMNAEQRVPAPATTLATAAAFLFRATDEHGELFPADAQFHRDLAERGLDWALSHVCGLDTSRPGEGAVAQGIRASVADLQARPQDWLELMQ